jgi:predicted nucleic acid-binding protein
MVLVDTSVWIRFLSNSPSYASGLSELLATEDVTAHRLVYGELLSGDRGGRAALLNSYALLPSAPEVPHEEVVAFVRARRLHGRGLGWVDVHLLASALVGHFWVWSADARLMEVANELEIAWEG